MHGKTFHHALAVQATSEQVAEFQALLKSTEAAKADVDGFSKQVGKGNGKEPPKQAEHQAASHESAVDQSVEAARTGNKKFLDGFSAAQKSGLKEITKRIVKADSDLQLEEKKLDQSLAVAEAAPEVTARAESLSKAVDDFYEQQLALGSEMSIVLANGQDLAFTLPQVKVLITLGGQAMPVTVSGVLSQTAVQGDQRNVPDRVGQQPREPAAEHHCSVARSTRPFRSLRPASRRSASDPRAVHSRSAAGRAVAL